MAQLPVISIIDDDASVRTGTENLVSSHGYIVHTFSSADQFLASSHVCDTSCIVADVQMPGTSGIELQELLNARGRRVPIIFITAFPDQSIRTKAIRAGAICFLTKPFEGPALMECIDIALQSLN